MGGGRGGGGGKCSSMNLVPNVKTDGVGLFSRVVVLLLFLLV
jgi:hypothetical protein